MVRPKQVYVADYSYVVFSPAGDFGWPSISFVPIPRYLFSCQHYRDRQSVLTDVSATHGWMRPHHVTTAPSSFVLILHLLSLSDHFHTSKLYTAGPRSVSFVVHPPDSFTSHDERVTNEHYPLDN